MNLYLEYYCLEENENTIIYFSQFNKSIISLVFQVAWQVCISTIPRQKKKQL